MHRSILTLALFGSLFAKAQQDIHVAFVPPTPNWGLKWEGAATYANGDVIAVLQEFDEVSAEAPHLLVVRLSSTGSVIWSKRLVEQSEDIRLSGPFQVEILSDGDALVYGGWTAVPGSYQSTCATRMGPDGQQRWARIYALVGSGVPYVARQARATPDGGFVFSLSIWSRIAAFHADEDGVPGMVIAISPDTTKGPGSGVIVTPDGSVLFSSEGHHMVNATLTSASGEVQWNTTYHTTSVDRPYASLRCANGDFMITGTSDYLQPFAMRINSTGGVIWRKVYPGGSVPFDRIAETATGKLLFGSKASDLNGVMLCDADGVPSSNWTGNGIELISGIAPMALVTTRDAQDRVTLHTMGSIELVPCDFAYVDLPSVDGTIPSIDPSVQGAHVDAAVNTWTMALYATDMTLTVVDACAQRSVSEHPAPALFTVQPNLIAAGDHTTVTFTTYATPDGTLQLVDVTGRVVSQQRATGGTAVLSTNAMMPGSYLVRFLSTNGTASSPERLVVR